MFFGKSDTQVRAPMLDLLHDSSVDVTVLVVSGRCCNPLLAIQDDQVVALAKQVTQRLGCSAVVHCQTVTDAQKSMSDVAKTYPELSRKVEAIFFERGMACFPIMIANCDVLFYGGVPPEVELAAKFAELVDKANLEKSLMSVTQAKPSTASVGSKS